ncbi:lysophosphatidylcholine acyltransferase [Ctenocephalides felis]|uniref:lysophosphatidylcholine acyltransferase n=1 Tax=Ctenocephalides felis TaxID=7515 RepID=UPI000E6E3E0F|nr:lysophosphatidylcholine acyltransferase [Ctenocephalides felis]
MTSPTPRAPSINKAINYNNNDTNQIVNPFVHKLELENYFDKIRTAVFTVMLMPFRIIVISILLILLWMLACIGLYGVTQEDLRRAPLKGWRRKLKPYLCLIGRLSYLAGGMAITVKGKRASRKEAPILVVAPHSSFLDSVIVYVTNMASIVVRLESNDDFYVGKLINYTQPVYVRRDDPQSRHTTIKEIIDRASSPLDWPQLLVFPEGTCTNRSCLITFKPGAFTPGVPVQPVCIRYPNDPDTVTWTWDGPGALKIIWMTLTQVHSRCEIEFLPVYYPNESEKNDPKLYAANVRQYMADALEVPVSDYTYADCKFMKRAKKFNLPRQGCIVEFDKLRKELGLHKMNTEEDLILSANLSTKITLSQLANLLHVSITPSLSKIFTIFDPFNTGRIDLRDYLLCALFSMKPCIGPLEYLKKAFRMFDGSKIGRMCVHDFCDAAEKTLAWTRIEAEEVFKQMDVNDRQFVTFEQFLEFAATRQDLKFLHKVKFNGQKRPPEYLKKAFRMFDGSKIGRMCVHDFCDVAEKTLAWTKNEAEEVFKQMDVNDRQFVTFEQFLEFAATRQDLKFLHKVKFNGKKRPPEYLKKAFRMFDGSKIGRMCVHDFCDVAEKTLAWTKNEAEEVFKQMDVNDRQFVTFEQFLEFAATRQDLKFLHKVKFNGKKEG